MVAWLSTEAGWQDTGEGGMALVCGWPPVPEPGPEVIAASHEAGVGGRMHDTAHDVVVAQGQQVSALSCARIPAAQANGPLVW